MEVILAKTAGFCFGVTKAVEKVYDNIGVSEPLYTYGPIIHNETVVNDLKSKGVDVLDTNEDIEKVTKGTVVIRSHGVSPDVYETIENQKLECIDATCPFVKRIHKIVKENSENGKEIVIIGNANHPEVLGIKGYAATKVTVIEMVEEAEKFETDKNASIVIVSQTTFNYTKFQDLVEKIQKKGYDISVANTICNATEERQTEAREIAGKVDAMIVIGSKLSSNSRKLYEICKKECDDTFFIQTLDDLTSEKLPETARLVGITAGASTPKNIIEEVQNYVRINF